MPNNNILYVLTLICTQWTQNLFIYCFAHEYWKYAELDFKSVEIIGIKWAQKKLFAKNICKLIVYIEEDKVQTPILHAFLPITFLLTNFSVFSS